MCNFFSALVLKNGDVLSHPMVDSHSELVEYFKLSDTSQHIRRFVKVELTPTDDASWFDASKWTFRLDEETKPAWWDDEMAANVDAELRRRVTAMMITDDRMPLILDGCWIVGGKAKIREVRSGRIVRLAGGTITDVGGGTITNVWGGTITNVGGGTITNVWGGTITRVRGGTITNVWGGTITDVGTQALLDASAKAHVAVKPQK